MKSIRLLLGTLGLLAVALGAVGAPDTAKDLSSLKSTYEKSLDSIVTNCDTAVKAWPGNYVAALKTLQTKLQKDGNLEGWSDVKTELDRFQADPQIAEENLSARAEVRAVQAKYREIPAQAFVEKNQKIVSLSQKYLAKLAALQSDLTKQGKMEDAMAVNAEIKRVKAIPELTSAEFELSELEAKKVQIQKDGSAPKPEVPEGKTTAKLDKPVPGEKPPPNKEPVEVVKGDDDEVKVYEGKAPAVPGVNFKNMQLRPTTNVGAKRKLNVVAMLGAVSDEEQNNDTGYHYSYKSKSGSTSSRVRLGLKTVASGSVLENVTVAVEYYCKEAKKTSGKISPEKMLVKCISVPKVDLQGVWIDCPEASTYKSSYSHVSGWGDGYREKRGKEFYGVIISVFESDKTLAFQAVTGSALEEFATSNIPEEKSWNTPPEPFRGVPPGGMHHEDVE